MDGVNEDMNLDNVTFDQDELVEVDEAQETTIPSVDVDETLLNQPFNREILPWSEWVKKGLPRQTVEFYFSLSFAERRDFGELMLGNAKTSAELVPLEDVMRFAEASDATLQYARNLKVVKHVYFHNMEGLHNWFMKQPDVRFIPLGASNDNNASGDISIGYSRGRYTADFSLLKDPKDFGVYGVKYNAMFDDMFADRPYKPQIRPLSPRQMQTVAGMLLVGGLEFDKDGWVNYRPYSAPTYRPKWLDPPVAIPDGKRDFYHRLWIKYFKSIDKKYLSECGNHFDFIANTLVKQKFRFEEEPPIQLFGFDFIKNEFVRMYNASTEGLTPGVLATEIASSVKAIDMCRGYRGTKPQLDSITHSMFELSPVSILGDSVSKARLIASIDQYLQISGSEKVLVYSDKVSGEVETWLNFGTVKKLGYSLAARVNVMENQAPLTLLKGRDTTESDLDVGFMSSELPVQLKPDTLVSLFQDPTDTKKTGKNYFDANKELLESLVKKVATFQPKRVIFPVHLSYLNDRTPLADLICRAKEVAIQPNWSRSHNTEVWVTLSGFGDVVDKKQLLKFNYALALAGRRKKLVNFVRDYLISSGHVFTKLGTTMSGGLAERALTVYCCVRKITESVRAAAQTFSMPRSVQEQISYDEVINMFPRYEISESRPTRKPVEDSHKEKRTRSPSVTSAKSYDSEGSVSSGKSWADMAEEEEEVALKVKAKPKKDLPKEPLPKEKVVPKEAPKEPAVRPRRGTANSKAKRPKKN